MTGQNETMTNNAINALRKKIAELRNMQLQMALRGQIKESADYAEKAHLLKRQYCHVGAA